MTNNKRGSILAVTIGLSIVFILLGYYAIYFSTVKRETFEKENMRTRAFWLAEAGKTAAHAELQYLFNPSGILQGTLANAYAANSAALASQFTGYKTANNALLLLNNYCNFSDPTAGPTDYNNPDHRGYIYVDTDGDPNTPKVPIAGVWREFSPSAALNPGTSIIPNSYTATVTIIPTPLAPGVPNPSVVGNQYTFHYQYEIISKDSVFGSLVNDYNKKVTITGVPMGTPALYANDHFRVVVNPTVVSYAKYNYFANNHWKDHWLVEGMVFNGPVHANKELAFANNPSITTPTSGEYAGKCGPYFLASITSASKTQNGNTGPWFGQAYFYNGGVSNSLPLADDENTRTTPPNVPDIPYYAPGFPLTFMVDPIGSVFYTEDTTPAEIQTCLFRTSKERTDKQTQEMTKMKKEALGGMVESLVGINVDPSGNGGIYINGDASIVMDKNGNNATYEITSGSCVRKVTINYGDNCTNIDNVSGDCTNQGSEAKKYAGIPDGKNHEGIIIYVKGKINNLSGTVQKDTAATVVSEGVILLRDDIKYEEDPTVNSNAKNLLGVVSWATGEGAGIMIDYVYDYETYNANIRLDGIFMTPGGAISAKSASSRQLTDWHGVKEISIFGGLIQDHSGAFGQFANTNTPQLFSGYSTYDARMGNGMAPPYFPLAQNVSVSQHGLDNKPIWSSE